MTGVPLGRAQLRCAHDVSWFYVCDTGILAALLNYSILHCGCNCSCRRKAGITTADAASISPQAAEQLPPRRSARRAGAGRASGSRDEAVRKPSASRRWRRNSGSRSRRPTGILPIASALLEAATAEALRQFSAILRDAIDKPSKQSKLSRFAQAALEFGLRRNGIYRLMFASRTMACAADGSELHTAAMETFGLLLEAFEAPAIGFLRERQALKIWAALHGVITLAEQGLLTGRAGAHQPRGTGRGDRRANQTGAGGRHRGGGVATLAASLKRHPEEPRFFARRLEGWPHAA